MKLSCVVASLASLLIASPSGAFAFTGPQLVQQQSLSSSTTLNLFGDKKDDGEKKGPGMMDQLAMFKKAQEMAQKKQKLDEELKAMSFEGASPDGTVKATFKYVPGTNPMDPNPDYEATKFEFDDAFFESASPSEIAAAAKAAVVNGIERVNVAVGEKYAVLQQDLMEALGQKKQ